METEIAISIVTYRTPLQSLIACLDSVLQVRLPFLCCVIDNASDAAVRQYCEHLAARLPDRSQIKYIAQTNIGYGRAHNIAITRSLALPFCRYHFAINPDIVFADGTIERLVTFMDGHPDSGAAMPRILYPDGSLQYLCKLLPSPGHLLKRRFFPALAAGYEATYTLQSADYDRVFECPSLSGCFMALRTAVLAQTGLFDPRYFLYFEDVDLIRRIGQQHKTLYCPLAEVTHGYQKGSYSNFRLLWYHIVAAFRYFNKWGWLDPERTRINNRIINSLPRREKTSRRSVAKV